MARPESLADRLEPGRRAFNLGAYFEAHELWEAVWRSLDGRERQVVQGLIQVAVGLHHLDGHRLQAARGVLRRGLDKLRGNVPRSLCHLKVEPLADDVRVIVDRLEANQAMSAKGLEDWPRPTFKA